MKKVRALWQVFASETEVFETVQFKCHNTTIIGGSMQAKREALKTPSLLDIGNRLSRQAYIDSANGQYHELWQLSETRRNYKGCGTTVR
jgi:hypothetical protein